MSAHIYLEGGESKEAKIRCREGFRKLLQKANFTDKMPRLTACGGRNSAYDDFTTAHKLSKPGDFVAMLVDSEDPVTDIEQTWSHLKARDGWDKPIKAHDEQAMLMTTCMETWIVSDRAALQAHYVKGLQESALPPLYNLENRDRHDVQDKLMLATRTCSNAYTKNKRSFAVIAELNPKTLELLPSFARMTRILKSRL